MVGILPGTHQKLHFSDIRQKQMRLFIFGRLITQDLNPINTTITIDHLTIAEHVPVFHSNG